MRPYAHEPFLYSIPRLPSCLSLKHGRSQSEVLSSTPLSVRKVAAMDLGSCGVGTQPKFTPPSPSTASPLSKCGMEVFSPYPIQAALTDAFQNSVSSGTSCTTSSFPPSSADSTAVSPRELPTPSTQSTGGYTKSSRLSGGRRRENVKITYPTGIARTSAAAPVLSFAHVEQDSTASCARDTRVGRSKAKSPPCSSFVSRARSPYPLVRGRRNSVLRERSMRFSDEDISGTLKHDRPFEKFGLEKYLSAGMQKRKVKDENVVGAVPVEKERGRTRSRARGGLRP